MLAPNPAWQHPWCQIRHPWQRVKFSICFALTGSSIISLHAIVMVVPVLPWHHQDIQGGRLRFPKWNSVAQAGQILVVLAEDRQNESVHSPHLHVLVQEVRHSQQHAVDTLLIYCWLCNQLEKSSIPAKSSAPPLFMMVDQAVVPVCLVLMRHFQKWFSGLNITCQVQNLVPLNGTQLGSVTSYVSCSDAWAGMGGCAWVEHQTWKVSRTPSHGHHLHFSPTPVDGAVAAVQQHRCSVVQPDPANHGSWKCQVAESRTDCHGKDDPGFTCILHCHTLQTQGLF